MKVPHINLSTPAFVKDVISYGRKKIVNAGTKISGLAHDTVQFSQKNPKTALVVGLGSFVGMVVVGKTLAIAADKVKAHKAHQQLQEIYIKGLENTVDKQAKVIDASIAHDDEVHEFVDQLLAENEALAQENAELKAEKAE